ncbi:MAG TPA: hypothetical protein VFL80_12515, partial [Thermoanaerobaculia bacterium]|nr:hypothetical protein [Thermoanaerobaculia bacterium]
MKRLIALALFWPLILSSCAITPQPPQPARFDQPDAAAAYYNAKRGIDSRMDAVAMYAKARQQMSSLPRYSTTSDRVSRPAIGILAVEPGSRTASGWTFLGPGNIGGRTRALIFDPADPNTLYAGAVSGGIWKSVDGGASWMPIGDHLTNIAVNSLAIDPADPKTLYAGTGEGYFREEVRGTALPLRGNGIFVTRDGGVSWRQLPFTSGEDFLWVNDLVLSRHDPRRLYAATRSGVWRSLDAGENWSRVVATTVKGGCLDLALRPDAAGDYLFASCGIFEQATIYRSERAEMDQPWSAVLTDPAMSRTTLAIAPSNPSIIYALAASNLPGPNGQTQNLHAVYRSAQNGDAGSWTQQVRYDAGDKLSTILLTNPLGAMNPQCLGTQGQGNYTPMGWHCNVIAVDPRNPDIVWAGGVDLFRSDDAGKSWGVAS